MVRAQSLVEMGNGSALLVDDNTNYRTRSI
ncbi:hypothetical protein COLO4_25472 [Corchorus olitorius]|uniref:Uncharacterized protein n=1 Tax=Corchorus olitorius TaxID=93759 RepID=A0A1R3I2A1_9ROSI|nr:hypothetical protein COLO4_25472 [Corchorus olitorius]